MLDVSRLRDLAISDSGFVFDPVSGHTYNVNTTALAMLRALKAESSVEAISQDVRAAFEVEPHQDLGRDVEEFIARLREHGLVR